LKIPATAVVLSDSASNALKRLEASTSPQDLSIARRARDLRPILLVDCLHGEVVRKSWIPRDLRARHGLENLYVEDLPDFWRLLYTIVRRDGRRVIVVVEIVSHKEYDRWFPGRRR
jgi:hypothetical protein